MKKDLNEGICVVCGKSTKFANLNFGYYKHCNTSCAKLDPEVEEKSQQTCLERFGVTNWGKTEQNREMVKKRMTTDGGAAYVFSFIKNPSKPQIKLFNIVKELYPSAVLNFPVKFFNRNIDIAIPEFRIAIEYDGSYWHQNKEDDEKRQKDIESLGWKFIRYMDYIPTKNELQNDINKLKQKFVKNNKEVIKLCEYFSFNFNHSKILNLNN